MKSAMSFGILLLTASVAAAQPPAGGGQRGAGGGGGQQAPLTNLQILPKDMTRQQVQAQMQQISALQQLKGQ